MLHKQHRDHSPPPWGAQPGPSAFLLTHPWQEGSHPGLGPPGGAMEIYRVPPPPSSPVVGKNSCHGSWDAQLVPSGLGPNTSSRASFLGFLRLAPPSSAWRWSFPLIQGRAALLRIVTPRGSCAAYQAHRRLSTSLLSWLWASPAPSCPGAPHLCCPCLDHFPHTCCYHGSSLGDRKALSASRPDWAGPEKSQGFTGQGQEGPAGGAAGQGTGQF